MSLSTVERQFSRQWTKCLFQIASKKTLCKNTWVKGWWFWCERHFVVERMIGWISDSQCFVAMCSNLELLIQPQTQLYTKLDFISFCSTVNSTASSIKAHGQLNPLCCHHGRRWSSAKVPNYARNLADGITQLTLKVITKHTMLQVFQPMKVCHSMPVVSLRRDYLPWLTCYL